MQTKARTERAWKETRVADLKRERVYCHPCWPSDMKFLKHEIETAEAQRSSVLDDPWDWFEIIAFLFNILLVIFHVVIAVTEAVGDTRYTLRVLYCVNSFIVWFRVLKSLRGTRMMGDYIIMLGHVVSITVRFVFLYAEILIPYVCCIWILFGGEANARFIAAKEANPSPDTDTYELFSSFNNLIFYSWQLSANGNFDIRGAFHLDEIAGKIIVASYLGITTILYFNLYVALVSHLYVRLYQTVRSKALLTQARILDRQEQMLPRDQQKTLKQKFKKDLNPLEERFAKMNGTESVADERRKMLTVRLLLEDTTKRNKLQEISNSYGKSTERAERITELFNQLYHQQDRINDKLDYIRDFSKFGRLKSDATDNSTDDAKSVRSRP